MSTKTRPDPIAATETFVAAIEDLMADLPKVLPSEKVDEAMLAYRQALGDVPGEIVDAVHAAIAAYTDETRNREVAQTMGRLGLRRVIAVADRTFTDFPKAADLAEAETDVERLAAEFDRTVTDLRDAVDRGDVDAVMRLRPEVEVSLPQRRETAQLTVLDLRAAQAELLITAPRDRKAAADAARAAAAARVEEAMSELRRWQQEFLLAELAADATAGIVTQAERAHANLVAERDQAAADASRSGRERLLRLAGLPKDEDEANLADDDIVAGSQSPIGHQSRTVLGGER